jgi:hypothetical protein
VHVLHDAAVLVPVQLLQMQPQTQLQPLLLHQLLLLLLVLQVLKFVWQLLQQVA